MDRGSWQGAGAFRRGLFHQRLAIIFGLQLLAAVVVCLMGVLDVAPTAAVLALMIIITLATWLAARRQWRPVRKLAQAVRHWDGKKLPDPSGLYHERLTGPSADADVALLAGSLYDLTHRIASFSQREREFTRDASHELRSPLTVIKMSADMLADDASLSEFGQRSVQRIKRSTRELEALVEALLILARESDNGLTEEDFVVNDVLLDDLPDVRGMLEGRSVTLELEEPARFQLHGSPRVFSVLCWQLIRNACQQIEQGSVVITVMPGVVSVTHHGNAPSGGVVNRHGFEMAIAQRISERFRWPLELQTRDGNWHIARIRFPAAQPI